MERNRMSAVAASKLPAATVRRIQASPFNVAAQLYETLQAAVKPAFDSANTRNTEHRNSPTSKYRAQLYKDYKKFLNVPRTYDEIHLHFRQLGYSVSKQAVIVYLRSHLEEFKRVNVCRRNPRGGPINQVAYVNKE